MGPRLYPPLALDRQGDGDGEAVVVDAVHGGDLEEVAFDVLEGCVVLIVMNTDAMLDTNLGDSFEHLCERPELEIRKLFVDFDPLCAMPISESFEDSLGHHGLDSIFVGAVAADGGQAHGDGGERTAQCGVHCELQRLVDENQEQAQTKECSHSDDEALEEP